MNSAWLRATPTQGDDDIPLFCLPHAGGNAALYHPWRALLPAGLRLVQVCLPGRLERLSHPMPQSFEALTRQLADAMLPAIGARWAIFGHSMGATLAHEVVLELCRRGASEPQLLAVSGRGAPQFHRQGQVHLQDDDALCAELIRLDANNATVLAQTELREVILPAIRADYRLIETYPARPQGVLHCPLATFNGDSDPEVNEASIAGWQQWSHGPFHRYAWPGGHFYLHQQRAAIVATLGQLLLGD